MRIWEQEIIERGFERKARFHEMAEDSLKPADFIFFHEYFEDSKIGGDLKEGQTKHFRSWRGKISATGCSENRNGMC